MTLFVALLGGAITLLGLVGIVRPRSLIRFVQTVWQSPKGLYLAIGLRVVFGLILMAAASESRFPATFRFLGIISLVAAAVSLALGFARLQKFVGWWTDRSPGFTRGWSICPPSHGQKPLLNPILMTWDIIRTL